MKLIILLTAISWVTISADGCDKKRDGNKVYKGRLEIKALCMNYTIKVIGSGIDTSLINAKWTDETTQKTYTNVFGLASRCDFPADINVQDEFSFTIEPEAKKDCMVCMAFYPTPPRKLFIKIIKP